MGIRASTVVTFSGSTYVPQRVRPCPCRAEPLARAFASQGCSGLHPLDVSRGGPHRRRRGLSSESGEVHIEVQETERLELRLQRLVERPAAVDGLQALEVRQGAQRVHVAQPLRAPHEDLAEGWELGEQRAVDLEARVQQRKRLEALEVCDRREGRLGAARVEVQVAQAGRQS